jgi:hypothetical protein
MSFCSNCGTEIAENIKFCGSCGTAATQSKAQDSQINITEEMSKKRHGFTTFWLILMLLLMLLSFIVSFIDPASLESPAIIFERIGVICYLISIILLLYWKKIGFWILIATEIYSAVSYLAYSEYYLANSEYDDSAFIGLFIFAVTIGVLHIRHEGKTTWEQLQ